ncbi:hypothetical protein NEMBOFW57_003725 [Staphylotrichum longicolle]|uniref:Heterokaryon incompatibility domain-containing protein n=1 Tax=Staphylotrichum longicolle TaxID=669026 RepID=A0AAD4I4Y5_9PEZI|nr:hypothetical protein NEMBOFW57_003725 [Staphylotrichum longicolle]
MRLLNVLTRELEDFQDDKIPQYAILSHTWGPEEVTLHEMEVLARYRRSQQEPITHMVSRPAKDPDSMKLMLLSTMLLAFRGNRLRFDHPVGLPALTNGDEIEDFNRSYRPGISTTSTHPYENKAGYSKIAYACGQAGKDGYQYVWIDTCCIDKRSSADVSEAVNSMFVWYQRAAVCYAYLEDVHFDDYTEGYMTWKDQFSNSRWFTRGWTLQELLAPRKVVFYAKGWRLLGTKASLVKSIGKITGIDELTLLEPKLIHNASVAQRMSWASQRTTTRTEDVAYSLMGLFGVNMPIIYGEGKRAFIRLQEEIIKRSDDHSIFAWGTLGHDDNHLLHHHSDLDGFNLDDETDTTGILAKSPRDFAGMEHVLAPPPPTEPTTHYTLTNRGLHITLSLTSSCLPRATTPIINPLDSHLETYHLAILNCHTQHDPAARLALLLTETPTPNLFLRVRTRATTSVSVSGLAGARPKEMYIPATATHSTRSQYGEEDEVVFIRAKDLLAPGYEVVDVRGKGARWNREFGRLRVGGPPRMDGYRQNGKRERNGVLYQLAVVAFWNRHLGCGFVVRILMEGVGKGVFVDLVQLSQLEQGDVGERGLLEEAQRLWESPGVVEVSLPGPKEDSKARKVVHVAVVNTAAVGETGEQATAAKSGPGTCWAFRPGHEIRLSGSVTFAERWERDYQRTVSAKVERKKKGVIELSMSSMLWQAAPMVTQEELDRPT